MYEIRPTAAILGTALLFAASGSARAEIVNCTPVTSLPATISSPGIYCLTGNLSTSSASGIAISITANSVTLDLNGWKLGGLGGGTATLMTGIYSTNVNITVRNGSVRGFRTGILLSGSGALVEDVLADGNTETGIRVGASGIARRNQVINTGGGTLDANEDAFGIVCSGQGCLVENNVVSELVAMGNGNEWGIYLWAAASNSTVRGNIVTDTTGVPGTGYSSGIRMGNTPRVAVIENSVTNFDYGIHYFGTATGAYSRNTVNSCTTAFSGGTAGSGNDSAA
ncbi:MAG TPA: hypothetical protein VFM29_01380 [Vicinamibacteria bacterium]|nr:hypothetical protein [Vicinamibacteria bacterium]